MTLAIMLVVVFCTIGLSTMVWGIAALCRLAAQGRADTRLLSPSMYYRRDEVAVLIAAHDEQLVIAEAVRAARALVPASHVFVVSDGSSDETVARAREAGAVAWDLSPNRGKAGAIRAGLAHFRIPERFVGRDSARRVHHQGDRRRLAGAGNQARALGAADRLQQR